MSKPNIIWIYCDELRTDALSCYGNRYAEIHTPHIDEIARQGVRFENCFCNSPVCVASRTSVLTGLAPEVTGVYHNEAVWPNYRFEALPDTLPALLARHGYTTANFGKVHVPKALNHWMVNDTAGSGMLDFYADVDRETLELIRPPGIPTVIGGVYPDDRPYPADRLMDNALAWLDGDPAPFFMRLSFLQPHTPVLPPRNLADLYADAPFPDAVSAPGTLSRFERRFGEVVGSAEMSPREIRLARVHYYALVAWLDAQVGRLLDYLRANNLLDETIIVFESDHGASLGEGGRYQKQTFAPESQRVPRLIAWPGRLAGNQVRSDLCQSLDLTHTLCALVGVDAPEQFGGRDLFGSEVAPEAIFSTIGYGFASSRAFPNLGEGSYLDGRGWPRRTCIRSGRYRLDMNVRIDGAPPRPGEEDIFLADVQADPGEELNLASNANYVPIVRDLVGRVEKHIRDSHEVPEAWTQRDPEQLRRQREARRRYMKD
jgi:choline-sulfatase